MGHGVTRGSVVRHPCYRLTTRALGTSQGLESGGWGRGVRVGELKLGGWSRGGWIQGLGSGRVGVGGL